MQETREETEAGADDHVRGWKLDSGQRRELLQQFPPTYRNVIADHVTWKGRRGDEGPLPDATMAEIVGRADDGRGVEAMVVSIGGSTDRPDGSTWHITWSLAEGRRAQESNDVLATPSWERFDLPMPVRLEPARFPRT